MSLNRREVSVFLWILTGALVVSAVAVHWFFMDIVGAEDRSQLAWRIWSPPALSFLIAIGWRIFRK